MGLPLPTVTLSRGRRKAIPQDLLVEAINRHAMAQPEAIGFYSRVDDLYAGEQLIYSAAAREVAGKRILDLGVGVGRTTPALTAISPHYLAIDYTQAMVNAFRKRYPKLDVRLGDARSLPDLASDSFSLVVFSCAGLDMANGEGRAQILKEVRRLLAPGGLFAFSTHNWEHWHHVSSFPGLPREPELGRHPSRVLRRAVGGALRALAQLYNKRALAAVEQRSAEWGIINTPYHNWSTMLYCVTLREQRRQLSLAGFGGGALAATHEGEWITGETSNTWMLHLLARKNHTGGG